MLISYNMGAVIWIYGAVLLMGYNQCEQEWPVVGVMMA